MCLEGSGKSNSCTAWVVFTKSNLGVIGNIGFSGYHAGPFSLLGLHRHKGRRGWCWNCQSNTVLYSIHSFSTGPVCPCGGAAQEGKMGRRDSLKTLWLRLLLANDVGGLSHKSSTSCKWSSSAIKKFPIFLRILGTPKVRLFANAWTCSPIKNLKHSREWSSSIWLVKLGHSQMLALRIPHPIKKLDHSRECSCGRPSLTICKWSSFYGRGTRFMKYPLFGDAFAKSDQWNKAVRAFFQGVVY